MKAARIAVDLETLRERLVLPPSVEILEASLDLVHHNLLLAIRDEASDLLELPEGGELPTVSYTVRSAREEFMGYTH